MKDNGFSFIRYLLAVLIVFLHYGVLADAPRFIIMDASYLVNAFFVISGFFATESLAHRRGASDYYRHRFWRIYPPYFCAVLFGLCLSFMATESDRWELLASLSTVRYVVFNLLTLNFLQPTLDGTFSNNPVAAVNGSLWFVKVLLALYILTPLIVRLQKRFNPIAVNASVYLLSLVYVLSCRWLGEHTGNALYGMMEHQFGGVLMYYVSGMTAYIYINKVKGHLTATLLVSLGLYAVSLCFSCLFFLLPISLAFLLVSAAFLLPGLKRFCPRTDISYELYLLHFPIIQTLMACGCIGSNAALGFAVSLGLSVAASFVLHLILSSSSRR